MNLLFKVNLCFIFLLCLSDLKGQTDFRPGFVITNENDTLRGLIDYRGDARNSKICVFKENNTSASKEYLPGQIKAYRFSESKYYVSRNILVNDIKKDLFLEFLVNGIADLYYYKDVNDPHYFIEKRDGQLFELKNTEGKIKKDDIEYILQKKEYIGLLKYAFADCPQLFETIDNATLGTKSLVNITKKYHNYVCNGEKCVVYEKKIPAIRVSIASYVSMNISNFKLTYVSIDNVHINTAICPSIGLLLNTKMSGTSEKLSFYISGELGKSNFYGTGSSAYNTASEKLQIHLVTLTGNVGFKYTYPKGKLRPTMMLGGSYTYLVRKDGIRIEEIPGLYSAEYKDIIKGDSMLGYELKLGVDYHSSMSIIPFLSLGYNDIVGVNNTRVLNKNIKTISINAGIYF